MANSRKVFCNFEIRSSFSGGQGLGIYTGRAVELRRYRMHLTKAVSRFLREENGAAIVEYGLALLVVAGIAIVAFAGLATVTNSNAQSACTAIGATC